MESSNGKIYFKLNLEIILDKYNIMLTNYICDQKEINGFDTFLRSDLINILLDFGYDTINIIDFSCRSIDEEIIQRDYNETTGKNYQCEYKINEDISTYFGDEVLSIHV